jgi:hypothetical protein
MKKEALFSDLSSGGRYRVVEGGIGGEGAGGFHRVGKTG